MRGWGIVAFMAAGVCLTGCGIGGPGRVEFAGGAHDISCGGMSNGAWSEQGDKMAARHPGATGV